MTLYLLFKMVHICAAIIFLGNIITGLFWMRHAVNSNNLRLISHTMKGIIQSDKWFTLPGIIIITAGGILAAIHGHYPILKTGWIFWSIILFSISGIAFAWKIAPLQQKIYKMTRDATDGENEKSAWNEFIKQYKAMGAMGCYCIGYTACCVSHDDTKSSCHYIFPERVRQKSLGTILNKSVNENYKHSCYKNEGPLDKGPFSFWCSKCIKRSG